MPAPSALEHAQTKALAWINQNQGRIRIVNIASDMAGLGQYGALSGAVCVYFCVCQTAKAGLYQCIDFELEVRA